MSVITQVYGDSFLPECWESIETGIKSCKFYAYIYHDKDIYSDDDVKKFREKNLPITFKVGDKKPKHIHFIAEDRFGLTTWSKMLGLPENFINITRDALGGQRALARYLIHKDYPEKFLYNASDVITNKRLKYESYLEDNQELSPMALCDDMLKVRKGLISRRDFLNKYQYFLSQQSFYSQYRIYSDLIERSNYDE